jgi:acyl-coenzyme A synthetase/AMP-(fatty) acid ligase
VRPYQVRAPQWVPLGTMSCMLRKVIEKYGEEIYAAVVLRPGHQVSEDQLKACSRWEPSAFEIPKRIFFRTDLPRTEKGAGDRRQLAALLGANS